jgi:hypothetical protein
VKGLPGTSVQQGLREASNPWFWQVSVTVDTDHAGGAMLGGGPNGTDHVVSARLSAARHRGLGSGPRRGEPRPRPGAGSGNTALGLFGIREDDPLRLVARLEPRRCRPTALPGWW